MRVLISSGILVVAAAAAIVLAVASLGVSSATPATADLSLTSFTVTTSSATETPMAGMRFQVTGQGTVHNAGPDGPVFADLSGTLTMPADCVPYSPNPNRGDSVSAVLGDVPDSVSWYVVCDQPGAKTFSVSATVSASDPSVTDAPGNNSATGSTSATVRVGACGSDPHPAGNILQNLSPQLILLMQKLTSTGTPVPSNLTTPLDCEFHLTVNDVAHTPIDECPVEVSGSSPCSLDLPLSIDMTGGSAYGEPTVRLNPVGVTFLPAAFNWANDTAIPNGTPDGYGDFSIRTDGGLLPNGLACTIDVNFPKTQGYEGGIQGNVPDSNNSADLTNPNVWPNDLNAERAMAEAAFSVGGLPTGVTLWSRTIVPLNEFGTKIPLNILTWKITNPVFQLLTGAGWVIVPFPGDALNPDPPGASGGNPDADDPPPVPTNYCAPHSVTLHFNGQAGDATLVSCTQPGSQMAWNLVDPDAVNVTGDEGPRSDTSSCGTDTDGDGLSASAEAYWGTSPTSADTDGDGVNDGVDNCKTVSNPGQADFDGDGIGDGCDAHPACGIGGASPLDFDHNRSIDVVDLSFYVGMMGANAPDAPYALQQDLDRSGTINIIDMSYFVGMMGQICAP